MSRPRPRPGIVQVEPGQARTALLEKSIVCLKAQAALAPVAPVYERLKLAADEARRERSAAWVDFVNSHSDEDIIATAKILCEQEGRLPPLS